MNDNPFNTLLCNPSRWEELIDRLGTALRHLPSTDWKPEVDMPDSDTPPPEEVEQIRAQLTEAYKPHAEAILKATISYLSDGKWPALQPPHVYYLRQMHRQALTFLQGFVLQLSGRPTTIFPFPSGEVQEVVLWFLTEWWLAHGLHETVYQATTKKALFYNYFS